ncbi:hypothetical protein Salat_2160300 [Sesamum alatum]|uniref:Uncharacterized protein n=1 Tax=Sesamum alatum TaxID=300844 RepID=A0AAE1Y1N6_9LAMI|nr:hypothetical protein Salat_2160300 [Sesamum alatum]
MEPMGQSKKNRPTDYLVHGMGESEADATWERDITLWQFEEKFDEYLAVKEGVALPTRASNSFGGGLMVSAWCGAKIGNQVSRVVNMARKWRGWAGSPHASCGQCADDRGRWPKSVQTVRALAKECADGKWTVCAGSAPCVLLWDAARTGETVVRT